MKNLFKGIKKTNTYSETLFGMLDRVEIEEIIKQKIEELDPNILSKNMVEKVSIIYSKDWHTITDEDVKLINALYKINVEDKKNAE